MPYVLLTAREEYAPPRTHERDGLRFGRQWAHDFDTSDYAPTPRDRIGGGPNRHVVMQLPSRRAALESSTAAIHRTIREAYELAAQQASHGYVGLMLGHGSDDPFNPWVDLAPVELLRIDLPFVENFWRAHVRDEGSRPMHEDEQLFHDIGAILRKRNRVIRFDLYTCSAGQTERGRWLLDWLHFLWQRPVRGLRGPLILSGNPMNPVVASTAAVMPPTGTPARGAFGREFQEQRIEGPGLWAHSRPRRHELTTPEPPPYEPVPPPPGLVP